MTTRTLTWPTPRARWSLRSPPPIGQGLAVIAAVAVILLCSAIGVGGYLASLRIAAARAEAVRLDHALDARRSEVATLRREFEIRSRMQELDRWRRPLDLQAIQADQIAHGSRQIVAVAEARQAELAQQAVEARPIDATPAKASYPAAARQSLNGLIGEVAAN